MIAIGQVFSGKMANEWYDAIAETENDVQKLLSKNKDRTSDISKLKAMAKKAREKRDKDGNTRRH
jgi:hypothetical protein